MTWAVGGLDEERLGVEDFELDLRGTEGVNAMEKEAGWLDLFEG